MAMFLKKLFFKFFKARVRAGKKQYLVEFRFHGRAKRYALALSKEISKKFKVKRVLRRGRPPHITLYGSFSARDEKELIKRFVWVCKRFDLVKFKVRGFSHIDRSVVQLDIKPSRKLRELREALAVELNQFCEAQEWDKPGNFIFHATLAFKDIEKKFDRIWRYLEKKRKPNIDQYLLRVTLLKNGKILREYDLAQRRLLGRKEALDKQVMKETMNILKGIFENSGKRKFIEIEHSKGRAFLISDTHFDHANIIKYTKRPFKNVEEMNEALVKNWNETVGENDTVYFLGDMAYGKGSRPARYWLSKLNGNIVFIEGNHEKVGKTQSFSPAQNVVLNYKGEKFLLIHDPGIKVDWNGWKIHGHVHNNDLENYPHINKERKTINVSVELIGYKPINLDKIIERIPS